MFFWMLKTIKNIFIFILLLNNYLFVTKNLFLKLKYV